MGGLAAAIHAVTTREVQGPSTIWYRVRPITSMDTLLSRAPMLLASLSPRQSATDKRGKVLPKAGEMDPAVKATIDTVYALATAGVVAWSRDRVDWQDVRLVEGEPGGAEESVCLVPWGDLSVISEAVAEVSGLTDSRRALQRAVAGDVGRGGDPVRG